MSMMQQPRDLVQQAAFGDQPLAIAAIVPRKFWLKYKPVMKWDEITKTWLDTGELRAEEWVEWDKKLMGSATIPVSCVNSIKRLQNGAKRSAEPNDEAAQIWRAIEPFYKNWKEGGTEEVTTGTPLAIWAGAPADVVELLKPFRILSVEDLSMIGDSLMQKLPHPNMAVYRTRAKKFLETKDIAIAVRQLDEKDARMAELEAMVKQLQKAHADAEMGRKEVEAELDEAAPTRRRRSKAA